MRFRSIFISFGFLHSSVLSFVCRLQCYLVPSFRADFYVENARKETIVLNCVTKTNCQSQKFSRSVKRLFFRFFSCCYLLQTNSNRIFDIALKKKAAKNQNRFEAFWIEMQIWCNSHECHCKLKGNRICLPDEWQIKKMKKILWHMQS